MKFFIQKNIPAGELIKLAWMMSIDEEEFWAWFKGHLEDLLERSRGIDPPCDN